MLRYRNGEPVRFPHVAMIHIIAATYGQDPEDVEEWPADKFRQAEQLLGVTRV